MLKVKVADGGNDANQGQKSSSPLDASTIYTSTILPQFKSAPERQPRRSNLHQRRDQVGKKKQKSILTDSTLGSPSQAAQKKKKTTKKKRKKRKSIKKNTFSIDFSIIIATYSSHRINSNKKSKPGLWSDSISVFYHDIESRNSVQHFSISLHRIAPSTGFKMIPLDQKLETLFKWPVESRRTTAAEFKTVQFEHNRIQQLSGSNHAVGRNENLRIQRRRRRRRRSIATSRASIDNVCGLLFVQVFDPLTNTK